MLVNIDCCDECGTWEGLVDRGSVTSPSPDTYSWVEEAGGGDIYCGHCEQGVATSSHQRDMNVIFSYVYHVFMDEPRSGTFRGESIEQLVRVITKRARIHITENPDQFPKGVEQEIYIDSLCWLNRGKIVQVLELPDPITFTPQ